MACLEDNTNHNTTRKDIPYVDGEITAMIVAHTEELIRGQQLIISMIQEMQKAYEQTEE